MVRTVRFPFQLLPKNLPNFSKRHPQLFCSATVVRVWVVVKELSYSIHVSIRGWSEALRGGGVHCAFGPEAFDNALECLESGNILRVFRKKLLAEQPPYITQVLQLTELENHPARLLLGKGCILSIVPNRLR